MSHETLVGPSTRLAGIPAEPWLRRQGIPAWKRVFDVVVATLALTVLAPLMLAIALAIYLESGRPIIFSQVRVGQHGRHFRLHKFRKFRRSIGCPKGADACQNTAVTLRDDRRMTRLGRLLASTKLDELPQFWNVLVGEMSIVGPRPESLELADCFDEDYQAVLKYRPGIFGPNQVFFRSESDLYPSDTEPETFYRNVLFPLKVRVDLTYFSQASPRADLVWLARGFRAVLGARFPDDREPDLIAAVESWVQQNAPAKAGHLIPATSIMTPEAS